MKKILKTVACMCQKRDVYNKEELINKCFIEFRNKLKLNNELLKKGNLKLDNNVARFPLPEVVTCCGNCKGCYAQKQVFPNVASSRLNNLFLIETALKKEDYKNKTIKKFVYELDKHYNDCQFLEKKAVMRWHDSGDIYSIEYLYLIINIAELTPCVKHFTYTKNLLVWLEYKKLKDMGKIPANFNIVSSIIGNHVNYFDLIHNFNDEYKALKQCIIWAKKHGLNIFMCNYAIKNLPIGDRFKLYKLAKRHKNFKIHKTPNKCGKCLKCCDYELVAFIKH